jgi:hypothetical protein
LGEIEAESAARARGSASGRGDDVTGAAQAKAATQDGQLINKAIDKYDREISSIDAAIAKAEEGVAVGEAKGAEASKKFNAARLAPLKSQRDNLLKVKDYLASLGSQIASGRGLTGARRAELRGILASVDQSKTSNFLLDKVNVGEVSTPPAPPAGTPAGTKRQNQRTGETWLWNGREWNKVG